MKCVVTTGEGKHGWLTFLHALFVVFVHFNLHISLHQICPNFQIIVCYGKPPPPPRTPRTPMLIQ